ncbi:hypothetical protein FRC01_000986 [Tulasnella sp. 417]|nr:hypothetical protein FRC01_000986 [Tulasnella sp. 417]
MAGKKRRTSTATTKTSGANETRSNKKDPAADPLAVPELLAHVFSFATASTLSSCALVCKQWSEVALDRLWRHLESMFPLLELLMGLELLRNWDLGSLDTVERAKQSGLVSLSVLLKQDPVFVVRLRRRPSSQLDRHAKHSPRSDRDVMSTPPEPHRRFSPFGEAQTKSLQIEFLGDSQLADDFFHAVAGRTPNLKSFTLKTPTPVVTIEASLQKAISTWKNLESFIVPPYYLRPSIMNTVASLPNLTLLDQDPIYHGPYDEATILQELPENFPKLQTFGFNSNPAFAQRLVQRYPALFSNLREILIDSANGVSDEEVLGLTRQLGKQCLDLTWISLNFCLGLLPQTEELSPLSFGVLEGLFPCRKLKVLQIGHPYPLTINDNGVERMAAVWPNMENFNVSNEPDLSLPIPGDMGNSLSILSTFARHFPELETLGLFFAKDQTLRFSGDLYPKFQFHQLKNLSVGLSGAPEGSSQEVGFMLASLCTFKPIICIGASDWYVGRERPEWAEYQRQWEEIDKSLELAMRTKIASRAKTPNMET